MKISSKFPSPSGVLIFLIGNCFHSVLTLAEFPSPSGVLIFLINSKNGYALQDEVSVPFRGSYIPNAIKISDELKNNLFPSPSGVLIFLMNS